MIYPQKKNPMMQNLQSQAAQMAAQKMDEDPNAPPKAPIVPTTNMRMPNMSAQGQTPPQPRQQMQQAQPIGGNGVAGMGQYQQPMAPRLPTQQPQGQRSTQMRVPQQPMQPMNRIANVPQQPQMNPQAGQMMQNQNRFQNLQGPQYNLPQQPQQPAPEPENNTDFITDADPMPVEDPRSRDQMFDDVLRELMGQGPRDTANEEALLREQMRRDVGANQARLMARMAAGGGGTSGALGAMSTDLNARAALEAAKGIEAIKENARDEWMDRVKAGMGAFTDDRGISMDENRNKMIMDMIKRMYGNDAEISTPTAPTSGTAGTVDVSGRPNTSRIGGNVGSTVLPTPPPAQRPSNIPPSSTWDAASGRWYDAASGMYYLPNGNSAGTR